MLDIRFIRENKDLVAAGAKRKNIEINLNKLIKLDDKRLEMLREIESARARQNEYSEKIASASEEDKKNLIEEMKVLKASLQYREEKLKELMKPWQEFMLQVPNIPDVSVPEGTSDEDNKELRTWGAPPTFDFEAKSHIDLMTALHMADFERGTKVAGFRGYILQNDGALLTTALWQFAQHFFTRKGFSPMLVPSLVRRELLLGTGYLPVGEEDLYKTQDSDYLAGTAEVPTMGYYMNEVLEKKDLPKMLLSFSPCFRREAGSHGKDTKGLMRVHEFFKWEQVVLCEASHEESVKHHEWLNTNTEELMQALGIPYRVVANCGGDLGLGQVKKYDIELWVPSEGKYREISSASYFHDFQARRLNIRYRDEQGKMRFVHSLNSTALPTPRILISIVENYQNADGSITIPEALQSYMGGKERIEKNA